MVKQAPEKEGEVLVPHHRLHDRPLVLGELELYVVNHAADVEEVVLPALALDEVCLNVEILDEVLLHIPKYCLVYHIDSHLEVLRKDILVRGFLYCEELVDTLPRFFV